MRIGYSAKVAVKDKLLDQVLTAGEAQNLSTQGINDSIELLTNEVMTQTSFPALVNEMKVRVNSYSAKFETQFMAMSKALGYQQQARQALDYSGLSKDNTSFKLGTSKVDNSSIQEIYKFMMTMQEGHQLLLDIRTALTGEKNRIRTKFIIQIDNELYEIDEADIAPDLIFVNWSGGTMQNPISLAYQIDKELINSIRYSQDQLVQQTLKKIEGTDAVNAVKNAKNVWLRMLFKGKDFEQWWDNKDSEIYEYALQMHRKFLSKYEYMRLRKSAGGGAGKTNTKFFKLGDVGTTQIKFFNLDKNNTAAASFARFGLLNSQFKKLKDIFDLTDMNKIKKALQENFTFQYKNKKGLISEEKLAKAIQEKVDYKANKIARDAIGQR